MRAKGNQTPASDVNDHKFLPPNKRLPAAVMPPETTNRQTTTMAAEAPPLYNKIPDNRYRFVDFVGEGFLLGAACGSAFYFIRGLRNSSPVVGGGGGRLVGAARSACANAPRIGGWFGAYSALLCALEGSIAHVRGKDDTWNTVAAGAAALGLFDLRLGGRTAAVSALYGAAIAAAFEGADWVAGEWDARFASCPIPAQRTNPGLAVPAAATPRRTDSQGSAGILSWWRSTTSTPSASTTTERDLELLDLSRKLLLEKMRKGFHSPVLDHRF